MKEPNAIEEFNLIYQEVVRLTNHAYLSQFLTYPPLDQTSWILLLQLLQQAELSREEREELVLPALLIQMALDHHEQVSEGEVADARAYRVRQLLVLAGDFYSARYYQRLALGARIPLIHRFAQAIAAINEAKMELYLEATASRDEQLLRKRDLSLFRVILEEGLPTAETIKSSLKMLEMLAQLRWSQIPKSEALQQQLQMLQAKAVHGWESRESGQGESVEQRLSVFIQQLSTYVEEKIMANLPIKPIPTP